MVEIIEKLEIFLQQSGINDINEMIRSLKL